MSTWIINPDKVPLDEHEQHQLQHTLSPYNISVTYDTALDVPPLDAVPSRTSTLVPLLTHQFLDVYHVSPGQEDLHIGIIIKDITALKGESMGAFNRLLQHIIQTFNDLGYGDYVAFYDLGRDYFLSDGKKIQGHCWEMMALGKGHTLHKDGNYPLTAKIWRSSYMLFNKTPHVAAANPQVIQNFIKILGNRLTHSLPFSSSFSKETLPWVTYISDLPEAREACCDRVLRALQSIGAVRVVEGSAQSLSTFPELPLDRIYQREDCAFCNEAIIQKQEMIHGRYARVLYNYRPYVSHNHFMVIPRDHQESFHCLPSEHFEEIIQWAQKITAAFGNAKDTIWFSQNGPRGGQTTPHGHLHVLKRPNPADLAIQLLNSLSGKDHKPVAASEYKEVREKLLKRLQL